MKKKITAILYFLTGIIYTITAIINLKYNNITSLGVVYLGLAITFISLGLSYIKQYKKELKNR